MTKIRPLLISAILLAAPAAFAAQSVIKPGQVWNDVSGRHINAHGGCVQYLDGTYYWFGEDRTGSKSNGISCYTSTDLYNWTRKGLVFKASQALDPETNNCILERPKVIYNDRTGKWVMYIHWENGNGYGEARVCVAVCDKIDGDYDFVSTFRPNEHDSRDQTIVKDSDGRAYHFCATDMNTNINVSLLSDDYLETEKNPVTETKILLGLRLEAPAIIRAGDTYFGVFSGCSGWDPNPGHSASATDILGYWTEGRNFAIDNGSNTTYKSQSTYIFPVAGKDGAYVYMGDRWDPKDVGGKSEYVWLPLSLRSGAPTVKWRESWDMSAFDDCDRFARIVAPADGMQVRLLDKYSDRWFSTYKGGYCIDDDDDDVNLEFRLKATDNPYVWEFIEVKSGKNLECIMGAILLSERNGADTQRWRLEVEEDGCYKVQSVSTGKVLSVSGNAQLAKSSVFMTEPGKSGSQSFGIYFDVRQHDYEKADMFSEAYREANRKAMEAQKEYENTGIGSTVAPSSFAVWADKGAVRVNAAYACTAALRVLDMTSGRLLRSLDSELQAGVNTLAMSPELASGMYIVELCTPAGRALRKLAL